MIAPCPAARPPRVPFGGVNEYPDLNPVLVWEEMRPTGAVLRCSVNTRLEAQLERLKGRTP